METTATTTHTAEQIHDAEFYRILSELAAIRTSIDTYTERLLNAAAFRTAIRGDGWEKRIDGATVHYTTAELPVGTIIGVKNKFEVVVEGGRLRSAGTEVALGLEVTSVNGINARNGLDAALATQANLRAELEAHEMAYTGWTRFMLVTSSTGHVHSSMSCSTCRWSTEFAPVVALSGSTADEAIAALGETLCSVCFPNAPIAGKAGKITAAAARKILAA